MALSSSTAQMQQRAAQEDESAVVVLALTLAASIASLAAIAVELTGIHDSPADQQASRLAIAGDHDPVLLVLRAHDLRDPLRA